MSTARVQGKWMDIWTGRDRGGGRTEEYEERMKGTKEESQEHPIIKPPARNIPSSAAYNLGSAINNRIPEECWEDSALRLVKKGAWTLLFMFAQRGIDK